jgi:hypothetical protein
MRVRLCARCPYTPRDVTGHYDPEAVLYLCAKCDSEHEVSSATTHAKRRGRIHAQQSPTSSRRRSHALPDLRRKAWPHTALFLPNYAMFKEVR